MKKKVWHKALAVDELPEGRVKTVTCEARSLCMVRFNGKFAALDNRCPHQGGPLGEGTIENGLLRCPWHGWDFEPLTGKSPGGFDDELETFPIEIREDGVYVEIESEDDHISTVSDVIIDTMTQWGVKNVWGMVGHSNLGLADAIRRKEVSGDLRFFGIRHEGAASFAASAYGKLTGRPAACLAIAGPGATNLLTGLWDANVDRSPTIALTGQVDSQVLGTGNFQEIDLDAAFGKVAQFGQTVLPESKHSELMTLACKTAILNRGVSHLIFPDEVQNIPAELAEKPIHVERRMTTRSIRPPLAEFEAAATQIRAAKRPIIVVGHGARFSMDGIVAFAERFGIPIVTTFKAKGLISDSHPLACGVLGRSGTPIASHFMNEADLLVVLGASFSKHTGIAPKVPTIQVDFDPMVLGKFHEIDTLVWGEISETVAGFSEAIDSANAVDQASEVAERWALWRTEKETRRERDFGKGLNSAVVFDALTGVVPQDAIIALDVGNNTYSFGRYFECSAQRILMSGYLGSIGFSLPAAMGAWAATTEPGSEYAGRKVISISGDGGLGQYLAELTTLVKYGMDVTHVVLNNSELGKISKEQRAGSWDVWQTSLHNPKFSEIATSCGLKSTTVKRTEDLRAILTEHINHAGPALVEIMTDVDLI